MDAIYISANPFDFNFKRTEYSDETYAIVGRALTIATKFESEVKALVSLFRLKSNPHILSDEQAFKDLIKELEKFQSLNNAIKQLNVTQTFSDLLTEAKDSRNYIAHELTLGLEATSESDNGRTSIIEDLKHHIQKIVEAEKLLLIVICKVNKEELPTKEYYNSYSERIVEWVVETHT